LPFDPLLAFMVLAMGAVAVAARVRDKGLVFTLGTFGQHQGASGSTAVLHDIQGMEMRRESNSLILFEKLLLKGFDD